MPNSEITLPPQNRFARNKKAFDCESDARLF
jgi:hypothetical protein